MNILIPDSWLKEYLQTNANPVQFAKAMSIASVSIERMNKIGDDIIYDIEVTTNRPELMSVEGIAREAAAVLPQHGYKASFHAKKNAAAFEVVSQSPLLTIKNDKTLVNRILAVILEIKLGPSPKLISERLEKTGIRSLNNVVDVTNYIMREVGHPSHVFDYDRLTTKTLVIRKSKKGETLTTLDDKTYSLPGNDIVADNGEGELVDLLGIMGTANSVVTESTSRVVLFLDNNNPQLLRKTSMNLGIRTEAAVVNEKGIDPELMFPTLLRGIELLKENANAKVISPIIDIYPNRPQKKQITISKDKIDSVIGVSLPTQTVIEILTALGFDSSDKKGMLTVGVPTLRANDIDIPEDIIEEIARIYGYHKIPTILPPSYEQNFYHQDKNEFFWIKKIKEAFRFWGFNETYTYSMVSEEQFEGPVETAIKLRNPLTEDRIYLRRTLIPSLIEVAASNKNRTEFNLFEISNVYEKSKGLPDEVLTLAILTKGGKATFSHVKGIVERVFQLLGIADLSFQKRNDGLDGAVVYCRQKEIGRIEVGEFAAFELNISELLLHASSQKTYIEPPKFPPIIEDIRVELREDFTFAQIQKALREADPLVDSVELFDVYQNKKTFRITYLNPKGNLTNEEVAPARLKLLQVLEKKFEAVVS